MRIRSLRGFHQLVDNVFGGRSVGIAHRQVDDILTATAGRHLEFSGDIEHVRRKTSDTRKLGHFVRRGMLTVGL